MRVLIMKCSFVRMCVYRCVCVCASSYACMHAYASILLYRLKINDMLKSEIEAAWTCRSK